MVAGVEVADTVEMTYFPAADIAHIEAVVEMMVLPFKSQKVVASCYYLKFSIANINT
jgi:hypothetical protein